jgi:chromosome segregation ATPase
LRKKEELEKALAKERADREKKLAPLIKERDSLQRKVEDVQEKVQAARDAEDAKTEELIRKYEEVLFYEVLRSVRTYPMDIIL